MSARKVAVCFTVVHWTVSADGQRRVPEYCLAQVPRRSLKGHVRRAHPGAGP